MKRIFSVFSVVSVVLFTVFLSTMNSACKKEKGDKGDTGTANVMYSAWTDVTFAPQKNSNGDTAVWTATMPAPKITKKILDSGLVKVYWNAGTAASPAIFPLPITDVYAATGVTNLNLYFTVGNINFYSTEDASSGLSSGAKFGQYRYIIIPPGVSTGRQAVNYNDYQAVKKLLNIPD